MLIKFDRNFMMAKVNYRLNFNAPLLIAIKIERGRETGLLADIDISSKNAVFDNLIFCERKFQTENRHKIDFLFIVLIYINSIDLILNCILRLYCIFHAQIKNRKFNLYGSNGSSWPIAASIFSRTRIRLGIPFFTYSYSLFSYSYSPYFSRKNSIY